MPAFRAVYLHSKSEEMREIERQIREHHVGGFISVWQETSTRPQC